MVKVFTRMGLLAPDPIVVTASTAVALRNVLGVIRRAPALGAGDRWHRNLIIGDHDAGQKQHRSARIQPAPHAAAVGVDHVDKRGPADDGNAESED